MNKIQNQNYTPKKYKFFTSSDEYKIDTNTWVVPYGNLMTFLMIFFFLLYAYTFLGSKINYEQVVTNVQAELAKTDLKLKKEIERKERETEFAKKLSIFMEQQRLTDAASVDITAKKIRIVFTEKAVLFASGSDALDTTAISILDQLADMISEFSEIGLIIIEGHTDNVPIRTKQFANNWELSIARAISVLNYFVKKKNIPQERFAIAGYGEFKPIAPNDTEENRAKNRRIELLILRT